MANSFVAALTQTCSVKLVPASFSSSDYRDLCIPPGVIVDRAVLVYVSMSPPSVSSLPPTHTHCPRPGSAWAPSQETLRCRLSTVNHSA